VSRVEGGGAERAQGKHISRQIDVKACALARRALISRSESGSVCKLRSLLRAKSESVCCCRKKLSLRLQWRQPESRTSQDGLDNVTTADLSMLTNYTSISCSGSALAPVPRQSKRRDGDDVEHELERELILLPSLPKATTMQLLIHARNPIAPPP
jgi:hypothetical protein